MLWKDSGGVFEQPPVGTHLARLIRIIDLGTQAGEYNGKQTLRRQVVLVWELCNELMTEGEKAGLPFIVSRFYTASLNEQANLRKDLQNWRGRAFTKEELAGFNPKTLLDKVCMLTLTLTEAAKVKVTGISGLPKGVAVPDRVNDLVYLSLEPDQFERKTFELLSDGYKRMIQLSPEWEIVSKGKTTGQIFESLEDDVPF